MEILKYRKDANSPWVEIAALVGAPGKDGEPGKDGANGTNGKDGANGKDGVDGKTPVKGTDYYTEADKQEMVELVLAALPAAEEVSF